MDPKEVFDLRAGRGLGPMEPAPPPGRLDSVHEAVFDRAPLPVLDPLPRMLEFQRKAESWFGFPYHCLMNVEYEPHGRLVLTFSTHEVAIAGRNLKGLYTDIVDQKCASIAEMDRATALATPADGFEVHRITIEPLRARKGAKRSAAPKPSAP